MPWSGEDQTVAVVTLGWELFREKRMKTHSSERGCLAVEAEPLVP